MPRIDSTRQVARSTAEIEAALREASVTMRSMADAGAQQAARIAALEAALRDVLRYHMPAPRPGAHKRAAVAAWEVAERAIKCKCRQNAISNLGRTAPANP